MYNQMNGNNVLKVKKRKRNDSDQVKNDSREYKKYKNNMDNVKYNELECFESIGYSNIKYISDREDIELMKKENIKEHVSNILKMKESKKEEYYNYMDNLKEYNETFYEEVMEEIVKKNKITNDNNENCINPFSTYEGPLSNILEYIGDVFEYIALLYCCKSIKEAIENSLEYGIKVLEIIKIINLKVKLKRNEVKKLLKECDLYKKINDTNKSNKVIENEDIDKIIKYLEDNKNITNASKKIIQNYGSSIYPLSNGVLYKELENELVRIKKYKSTFEFKIDKKVIRIKRINPFKLNGKEITRLLNIISYEYYIFYISIFKKEIEGKEYISTACYHSVEKDIKEYMSRLGLIGLYNRIRKYTLGNEEINFSENIKNSRFYKRIERIDSNGLDGINCLEKLYVKKNIWI